MDGYCLLICLVATISYCSSAPESLDSLTINLNIDGSEGPPPTPIPIPPTDFNCTCGIKNPKIVQPTTRIVGGQNTGIFEYPWMVSIKTKDQNKFTHMCGGVLVASQWVLTNAHCPKFLPKLYIFLGEHDQTRDTETDKTRIFHASETILHPDFVPRKDIANNNIALLKLDGYADLTVYTPACLPEANQFFGGMPAIVTGWGSMQQGDPTQQDPIYPAQLQWIDTNVGDDQYCQEHDKWPGRDYEHTSMTCSTELGIPGKGECIGDSGGPMTVEFYGRHYLAGLLAGIQCTGRQCCGMGTISIYTSTTKLKHWIDQTIEENGGAAYCTPTPFPFEE